MAWPLNIYDCCPQDLLDFDQVGSSTAEAVISLAKNCLAEEKDMVVSDLTKINAKVDWQGLIDNGELSLIKPKKKHTVGQDPEIDIIRFMQEIHGSINRIEGKLDNFEERLRCLEDSQSPLPTSGAQIKLEPGAQALDSINRIIDNKTVEGVYNGKNVNPSPPLQQQIPNLKHVPVNPNRITTSGAQHTFAQPPTHMPPLLNQPPFGMNGPFPPTDYTLPPPTRPHTARRDVPHAGLPAHNELDDIRAHRPRSRSPKIQPFSGEPSGGKFDIFLKNFRRIADRREWDDRKRLDKLHDSLTGTALEYACMSGVGDFNQLVEEMATRFDYRDEPMAARQKLSVVKQGEESEEEFLQRIQVLASDGYREIQAQLRNSIMVEAFLRGLKNKDAALDALGRAPHSIQDALRLVKAYTANAKVLGVGKQVTFSQKAVTATHPQDESLKELGNTILKGMDNLLRQHLGPRSRSPSPGHFPKENEPRPYGERFSRSDSRRNMDYNSYRSPDRMRRAYSPNNRYRDFSPRERYGEKDRRNSPSPHRPYDQKQFNMGQPNWSSTRNPGQSHGHQDFSQSPYGQSQRRPTYAGRSVSQLPADEPIEDLNSEGLPVHATHG